jgi:cell division protein ZapA (FtsZ GTPase activity inhibitor)
MLEDGRTRNRLEQDLLVSSLQANPYNDKTWMHLAKMASEKKMKTEAGIFWINQLLNLTVKKFPDFTVECLSFFLQCVDDKKFKAMILSKVYNMLRRSRADLACDIKLYEGDLWREEGEIAKAVLAYAYPLVNFSQDTHVLDIAKKKIAAIDKEIDAEKLETAYVDLIKSITSMKNKTKEIREIRDLVLAKLVALYEKKKDEKKAKYYKKFIGKN